VTIDLLVLGGTAWLGGAVARAAGDRGHRVTCLARGESGTPPDHVTWVRADRTRPDAYDAVAGRHWDAVVDVSWQPELVASALARLATTTDHWVYVSSASVYADDATPGAAEDAPLHRAHDLPGPVDRSSYGEAKVACERRCVQAMGEDRVLLARAGLIVGYGDPSDRFGYWPARLDRARDGEPVLVPPLAAPVQLVDVEDLAQWLVTCCERRTAGPMNAVGPVTTLRDVLATCQAATGRSPRLVEATDEWLSARQVEPWSGPESLPLWVPHPEYAGHMTRRNDAAVAAGLRLRPLARTVAGSLAWERSLGPDRERRAGLSPAREADLLAAL
jgi:2'-hydroxyisoflavone reductase